MLMIVLFLLPCDTICNEISHKFEITLFFRPTGPGQLEKLKYRFKRETTDGSLIKDVYDGELYKMFSGPGGLLASATNISLLGNTDGVALIRSSNYGVWPVFLVINELSPLQR